MKKRYELAGMNCSGCVNGVKQALLKVPDGTEAEVNLNPQTTIITMTKPINIAELQSQLNKAGHYTIKEVA